MNERRPLQYETPTAAKWSSYIRNNGDDDKTYLRLLIPHTTESKKKETKEIDPRINNKHEANHPKFVLINRANTANDEHSNANANEASEVVTVVNIHM